MTFASARTEIARAIARAIAPRKPMWVSEWARRKRKLSRKGSAVPGEWDNSRNPLQVEIMDCFSARSPVHDVVGLFPIQFGKSEMETNVLGYTMEENPQPIMVVLPGEVSMNKWIDQKLNPMIDETPSVQRVLTSTASRESSNRRSFKDFNVQRTFDGDLVRQIISRAVWVQLMKKPDSLLGKGEGGAVVSRTRHDPPRPGSLAPTSGAQKSCQGKHCRYLQQPAQRHISAADAVANPRNGLHEVN